MLYIFDKPKSAGYIIYIILYYIPILIRQAHEISNDGDVTGRCILIFLVSGIRVPITIHGHGSAGVRLIEKRRRKFHFTRRQRENFICRQTAARAYDV